MDMYERYKRQIVLPEIGESGQHALSNAKVLCVGAGGLGSPTLLYLAAAGVGTIGIADFDTIDQSNLQRQILFSSNAVGDSKAEQAKERITALNPHITVHTYPHGLTLDNVEELFDQYDLIIDGTDNFNSKYLMNDAAVKFSKPWIYGAIQGFEGQASVFDAQKGACYRCLFPEPPKSHIPNCAENGVIGAVAGLVGVTQSLQAIQIITGHESFEPLINKLWLIDARTMQSRTLNISKTPSCPVCSKQPKDITLEHKAQICLSIPELSPKACNEKQDHIFIDVREQHEWQDGHIAKALHFPLSSIQEGKAPEIEVKTPVILYCQKGQRSLQAAQILKEKGFEKIYNMTGGYDAWLQ